MQLTRAEAEQLVRDEVFKYFESQLDTKRCHEHLKNAIKRAKTEGGLTQQEIADLTVIENGDDRFDLSRQRISQIINE